MAESMDDILHPGAKKSADPDFPNAPEGWQKTTAIEAAKNEGLALDDDHWELVRALQEYFAKHERPNVRELVDALEEKFYQKGGLRHLYKLFPGGPVAQGCRLAGIEVPAGAVDKGFGSVV
jgi:tRNA 2-thiouridine synthesizing protein E